MPKVSATIEIAAAPETVFDVLADYRTIPKLQPQFDSVKLVSDVERGLGAVMELRGTFHGLPMRTQERIITFSPPHRLVSIGKGAILSRTTWELKPSEKSGETATHVSIAVDYKASGPFGGVLTGLASSLFHKEIQEMTDESLRRLQAYFTAKD